MAELAAKGRPVVLTGSPVVEWPALRRWTPVALASRLAEIPPVDESANRTFWWSDRKRILGAQLGLAARQRHARVKLSPAEFFGRRDAAAAAGGYRQLHARLSSHTELAALAADVQPRAFLFTDARGVALDDLTLWCGEAETSSHTHYDVWPNSFAQVVARSERPAPSPCPPPPHPSPSRPPPPHVLPPPPGPRAEAIRAVATRGAASRVDSALHPV